MMSRKKTVHSGKDAESTSRDESGKRLLSRLIDSGLELLVSTGENNEKSGLRPLALPKELINYFFSQMDRGKSEVVSMIGREFKRFLEATDLSEEVVKAMSQMSVEVKAEIKFNKRQEDVPRLQLKTKTGKGNNKR